MNDRAPIRDIAADVARELGATLLPLNPERDSEQYPRISTAEGPELSMHYHWQTKRVVTSVNLPPIKDRDGNYSQQSARELEWLLKRDGLAMPETSITTDPKRNTCVMARDIRRRLLPGAIVLHTAALKRKADFEANTAGVVATIEKMCKALKFKHDARHGTTLFLESVRLEVSSPNSIRFESFYVDADTALAIYKLIRASKADE